MLLVEESIGKHGKNQPKMVKSGRGRILAEDMTRLVADFSDLFFVESR